MGLNRIMMGKGGVKVEDGSKRWEWKEIDSKTVSFTVPPGVKRIKVFGYVDVAQEEAEEYFEYDVYIQNKVNKKIWGDGMSVSEFGHNIDHKDIDSVVGVTPNKTYALYFNCYYTSGVTFSWGKAINAMTPTVEDY